MALEVMQGFDYGTAADLFAEGWGGAAQSSQTTSSSYSRYVGGQGLQIDGTSAAAYLVLLTTGIPAFTSSAIKVIGFSINIQSGLSTSNCYPIGMIGTTTNCSVLANPNGSVSIYNSAGTLLVTSAVGLLALATWAYIELKSTGSQVICAINGAVACTATLSLGNINRVDIGSREFSTSTTGYKIWIDDFYALNGTATTPFDFLATPTNNPFIQTPRPTAAGNYTAFTPNGAVNNYTCVADITEDGDTTYVNSGTVAQRDSYTHGALTGTISSIVAVDEIMYARLDPAGTGAHSISQSLRIGGVDYDATAQTLVATYAAYHNIRTISPATSAVFTSTEINAMEIGQKVVS